MTRSRYSNAETSRPFIASSANIDFADHEEVWFSETETWFNEHLKAPNRFQLSERPGAPHSAITWLRRVPCNMSGVCAS